MKKSLRKQVDEARDNLMLQLIEEAAAEEDEATKNQKIDRVVKLEEARIKMKDSNKNTFTNVLKIASEIGLSLFTLGVWDHTQRQYREWEEKGYSKRGASWPKLDGIKWFRH